MSDGKVLITVYGGVADYDIVEGDIDVELWDYDNMKEDEDAPEEYAALPDWAQPLITAPDGAA